MHKIGIRGAELGWFCSYLTNQSQFVKIGDAESISLTLTKGIPQSSVLGPILFFIYIKGTVQRDFNFVF
jgi:hypothetical protein